MDAVFGRCSAETKDVQQLTVVKEEFPTELQEWSSSLDQEDPEPPHIKEEQEEPWSSQEGELLQGLEADIKIEFTLVPVKSEEEEAPSSQLHQRHTGEKREAERTGADGEDHGGSEPARNSDPESFLQAAAHDETSRSSECDTEDSRDWEETREPQSHKHTGAQTQAKTFSCSFCSKEFTLKQHLRRHLSVHTGKKQFICSVCGKTFTDQSNLRRHLTVHTGEKPFSCSVCGKGFTQQQHLRRHLTVHTEEKRFSCSVCGKKFSQKEHLGKHSTVHTGVKVFSCLCCSKTFADQSNLKRHLTVHTGEKTFSCSVCSRRFKRLSHLRRHMSVHKEEKPR